MNEVASEIFGARERPYDMRWGTPDQVREAFGINVAVLKAAWKLGWVRARQANWESDEKRTQTVYCFEDIHGYMERVAHQVSETYAEKWWTDETVADLAERTPDGPYRRARITRGGARESGQATRGGARESGLRKDGFERLPRNGGIVPG